MHSVLPSQVLPAAKGWRASLMLCLGPFLRTLRRHVTEPWLQREAIRELRRLRPRDLRDIGLEPYALDDLVDDMLAKGRRSDGE